MLRLFSSAPGAKKRTSSEDGHSPPPPPLLQPPTRAYSPPRHKPLRPPPSRFITSIHGVRLCAALLLLLALWEVYRTHASSAASTSVSASHYCMGDSSLTLGDAAYKFHINEDREKGQGGTYASISSSTSSSSTTKHHDPRRPLPSYTTTFPSSPPPNPEQYTLIINTFRRPDQLRRSIRTYEHCPHIAAIRVIWSEPTPLPTPQSHADLFSDFVPVTYDKMETSSFNNRFRPLPGLETEAVVSIDDDMYLPCRDLDAAFARWKEHPRQLVGFHPRSHQARLDVDGTSCLYDYVMKLPTLWLRGYYSMVLTKASFLHRDYLSIYTEWMDPAIASHVDKARNCEDIAMQYLVSYITREAPELVYSGHMIDMGQGNALFGHVSGVSAKGGHQDARSECLTLFAQAYGGKSPLVARKLATVPDIFWIRLSSLVFWR